MWNLDARRWLTIRSTSKLLNRCAIQWQPLPSLFWNCAGPRRWSKRDSMDRDSLGDSPTLFLFFKPHCLVKILTISSWFSTNNWSKFWQILEIFLLISSPNFHQFLKVFDQKLVEFLTNSWNFSTNIWSKFPPILENQSDQRQTFRRMYSSKFWPTYKLVENLMRKNATNCLVKILTNLDRDFDQNS